MSRSISDPPPHTSSRRSRLRRKGLAAIAALGVTALALTSCATGPGDSTQTGSSGAQHDNTLRVAIGAGSNGAVLDPHSANDQFTVWFANMFYERLVIEDPTAENGLRNILAESFTPNDDGSSWTVTLKEGVAFHNGEPFTADDVIYSFTRMLDPAIGSAAAGSLSNISDMEKVDDHTVRFDLATPTGIFPEQIAGLSVGGIVQESFDAAQPVSTGPWLFESFEPGVDVSLNRNDDYHGEPAKLDSVVLLSMPDVDARTNALLGGQIDVDATLEGSQVARLQGEESLEIVPVETGGFEMVFMRVDQGLTADPRVREAIRLAIDRQQIITVIDNGNGRLANDLPGVDDPLFRDDLVIEQNLEEAKKLLEEAGVVGQTITLTVPVMYEATAQIVAQNVRDAGLDVVVDAKDPGSFYGGDGYLQYDFGVEIWGGTSILSFVGLAEAENASLNYTHMNDPDIHRLYALATSTLDETERAKAVSEIQEILFDRGGYAIPRFVTRSLAHPVNTAGWPTSDPRGSNLLASLVDVHYTD